MLSVLPGIARAEGPGFKVGDTMVLHLGAALGGGYDSNLFYSSGLTPPDCGGSNQFACGPTQGAGYIDFRPGIDLATNPVQRGGDTPHGYDFRFHAGLPLRFLVSTDQSVYSHYSVGAEVGLLLRINPYGTWSFDLYDNFARTSQLPYAVVVAPFVNAQAGNINNDQNGGGFRLTYRPGGNRLEATLQYTFGMNFFESSDVLTPKSALTNDFQFRLKWNFFPKTGLYINVAETTNNYPWETATATNNVPPPAYPLRAVAGLIGLITPKLSLNANVGYANSFSQSNASYMNVTSYSSAVGLLEAEWRPTIMTILNLGYRHDFAQALIGTYYNLDTAYFGLNQILWRINAQARLAWERRDYQGDLSRDGLLPSRVDNLLVAHVEFDLPIRDYLTISIGDDLAKNWSTCRFDPKTFGAIGLGPSCDYLRNDVWLRLAFAY